MGKPPRKAKSIKAPKKRRKNERWEEGKRKSDKLARLLREKMQRERNRNIEREEE